MSAAQQHHPTARNAHRGAEMAIFAVVSVIGVYALGEGLRGLFSGGGGVELGWLAVAAGAYWVLYAQMCRVQATWPRRRHTRRTSRLTSGRKVSR